MAKIEKGHGNKVLVNPYTTYFHDFATLFWSFDSNSIKPEY